MGINTVKRKTKNGVTITYLPWVSIPGERKKVYGSVCLTREDAEEAEFELKRAHRRGEDISKPVQMKLKTVAEQWISSSEGILANATLEIYKDYYYRYIDKYFGDKVISKIQPIHIQRFIDLQKSKYAPATVNKMIEVLAGTFNFGISPLRAVKAADNPMVGIKRIKRKKTRHKVWTTEQVSYFLKLDFVRTSNYYAMLCISLMYGARPGEVCGISENDFSMRGISLDRGYDRYGKITDLKTDGSHRFLPFPEELSWLYKLLNQEKLKKKKLLFQFPELPRNDFLFIHKPSEKNRCVGNPIRPDTYYKNFKKLIARNNKENKTQLPEISLYDLRHTYATINIMNGENAKMVSEIMGNTPEMVLSRYAHISENGKKQSIGNYAKEIM